MTWDGIVTSYHKKYRDELEITDNIQAYIQSRVLRRLSKAYLLNKDES